MQASIICGICEVQKTPAHTWMNNFAPLLLMDHATPAAASCLWVDEEGVVVAGQHDVVWITSRGRAWIDAITHRNSRAEGSPSSLAVWESIAAARPACRHSLMPNGW